MTVVDTPTAADLEREALARSDADVIVMAAAVADYRPAEAPARSARRTRSADGRARAHARRPRGARRQRRGGQVLVGFAADGAGAGLERAREKRLAKRADLFVFNDMSRADIGFDVDENEVVLVSNSGSGRSRGGRNARSPRSCSTRWSGYSRRDDRRGSGAQRGRRRRRGGRRRARGGDLDLAVRAPRETLELCVLGLLAEGT